MAVRLVIGLVVSAVARAIAGRRVLFLYQMIRSGTPAPGRFDGAPRRAWTQLTEVLGQRKLLKWTGPGVGVAHRDQAER